MVMVVVEAHREAILDRVGYRRAETTLDQNLDATGWGRTEEKGLIWVGAARGRGGTTEQERETFIVVCVQVADERRSPSDRVPLCLVRGRGWTTSQADPPKSPTTSVKKLVQPDTLDRSLRWDPKRGGGVWGEEGEREERARGKERGDGGVVVKETEMKGIVQESRERQEETNIGRMMDERNSMPEKGCAAFA